MVRYSKSGLLKRQSAGQIRAMVPLNMAHGQALIKENFVLSNLQILGKYEDLGKITKFLGKKIIGKKKGG